MPDYQKAKIYKLWSPEGDDIYIGSTTTLLCRRKAKHKRLDCSSKILFEKYNDVRIELLECCPCDNKEELAKREGEYIRNNDCVNKVIPDRTPKEYYQDNKEYRLEYTKDYYQENKKYKLEYSKDYREKNKEKLKEIKAIRVICECGLEVNKNNIARHKLSQRHLCNLK